jgi:4-alpha-glucanotransferase
MGMSYWQVLPLTPPGCGNSPYSAFSAFAGNPLLLDTERIANEGDTVPPDGNYGSENRVDFSTVSAAKMKWLNEAASRFLSGEVTTRTTEFRSYCETAEWLHDYALFMALKGRFQDTSWDRWPTYAAQITKKMYQSYSQELGHEIDIHKYLQWQFSKQWNELHRYATEQGIAIIGDIPIFVAYNSADVWSNRRQFLLGSNGYPTVVAGVPPDYFSATGQLWGNPHYDWDVMAQDNYGWWIKRFRSMFQLFDVVRIDHFRGFAAAWHVPSAADTAENGSWINGPKEHFFDALHAALGSLPIVAEDLGVITDEVEALRDRFNFPGMKILQFAFDSGATNPYLPHNHIKHGIVYTGTHDNDTTKGWYESVSDTVRSDMNSYLGASGEDCVTDLVRAALMSVADTAIIPFQDILQLGGEARMNIPGTASGNWEWRFSWDMLPDDVAASVRNQLERYGRAAQREGTYAAL